MRILHVSDTHGVPPEPPEEEFDVIVHTGDLLPNRTFGIAVIEESFQRRWIAEHAPRFPARYRKKRLIFCPGNHEFIDPTGALRSAGIDASFIAGSSLMVDGVTFYGHPWTPVFCDWNWMCRPDEMERHLRPVAEMIAAGTLDVLVSHGPLRGVLDRGRSGERIGCPVLRDVLNGEGRPPRAVLHGHIHEAAGVQVWSRGVLVSNAACTQRVIVLPEDGSPAFVSSTSTKVGG